MKYSPFKILLWMLFVLVVLLNSFRLFIYGFVISFIIVIIDRAFFGTRKRSDTQFLNLFFTCTLFFAIGYTFSPFFRSLEFEISHPRWTQQTIEEIEKKNTHKVYTPQGFLEKEYTSIEIIYIDKDGTTRQMSEEVKHYAMPMFPILSNKTVLEKELDYIHQRGLNKLIDKKSIHLFKHPHKNKLKVFKGMDAFAVRHSIGSAIVLLVSYLLFVGLTIYVGIRYKTLKQKVNSSKPKDRITLMIITGLLLTVYIITITSLIHYLKFI
ncbi:MAG TPA: hypothetical protein VKY33_01790 [Flavobacterium sp.]|nr:hypothetical protein [Flavobacterium sp.]